jgi:hypothetical protein
MNSKLAKLGFKPIDDDGDMFELDLPDGTLQVYQDDPDKMDSWFVSGPNCYFIGPFTLPEAADHVESLILE